MGGGVRSGRNRNVTSSCGCASAGTAPASASNRVSIAAANGRLFIDSVCSLRDAASCHRSHGGRDRTPRFARPFGTFAKLSPSVEGDSFFVLERRDFVPERWTEKRGVRERGRRVSSSP